MCYGLFYMRKQIRRVLQYLYKLTKVERPPKGKLYNHLPRVSSLSRTIMPKTIKHQVKKERRLLLPKKSTAAEHRVVKREKPRPEAAWIAARRQQPSENINQQALLQSMFDNHSAVMLLIDPENGKIIKANQSAEAFYGYTTVQFKRLTIYKINKLDRTKITQHMQNVLKRRHSYFVFPHRLANGEIRDVEVYSAPIPYEGRTLLFSIINDITDRSEAEKILKQSEAEHRGLFENALDGIYRSTPQGRLLAANPALVHMLGYDSQEELLQLNIRRDLCTRSKDRQSAKRALKNEGELRNMEVVLRGKDGREVIVLDNSRAIQDENGKVLYYEGTLTNITEFKRVEQSLIESEERYRAAFEQAAVGVSQCDITGKFLSVNQKLCEITGYSRQELLGKTFQEITFPEDLEKDLAGLRDLLKGRIQTYTIEKRYVRKDGSLAWVELTSSPVRNAEGKLEYLMGIVKDIGVRKQAEEALQESEHKYRALFENAVDGIYRLGLDGAITAANPALVKMLGYDSEEELLSVNVVSLYSSVKDAARMRRLLLKTGELHNVESVFRRKDGRVIIGRNNTRLVHGPRGDVLYYEGSLADVTQEKRAADALRRRASELDVLYENSLSMGLTLEPHEIARKIIEVMEKKLDWHHVAIRQYRRESGILELLAFNMPGIGRKERKTETARLNQLISRPGQGLSGWVIQTGETVRSGSVQNDPRYADTYPGLQSGLYVPMKIGDQVIGSIAVESELPDAFDEDDERLVATLAAQSAVAIENARLFSDSQVRVTEFSALYEITRDLVNVTDLSVLLKLIAERAATLLRTNGGAIYLFDSARDELVVAASSDAAVKLGTRLKVGEGLSGHVARTRQPLIINDYSRWAGRATVYKDIPFNAVLGVPMLYGGDLIGVLVVHELSDGSIPRDRQYTEADTRLISMLASAAAGAVYSTRLFKESQERADQFAALYETTRDLSSYQDVKQLLNIIVERAARLVHTSVGGLYLYDPESNELEVAINFGLPAKAGIRFAMGEGAAGRVAQARQPMIVDDYQNWEGRSPKYDGIPVRAVLQVPMIYSGELIGILTADEVGDSERKFTEADMRLFSLFASAAAGAVYSARLFEQTSRRAEEFKALAQAGESLTSTLELQPLLENVLEAAQRAIPAGEKGTVLLWDESSQALRIRAQRGYHDPRLLELPFNSRRGYSGRAFREKLSILIEDARQEYQVPFDDDIQEVNGVQSGIVSPLVVKGEAIGVIALDNSTRKRAFIQADLNLLEAFAQEAAAAIENARLYEEIRHRVQEMSAVGQVSAALRSASTRIQMMPVILDKLLDILPADGAVIGLIQPPNGDIFLELGRGSTSNVTGYLIPAGGGISTNVIATRQPYVTSNVQENDYLFSPELLKNVRAAAAVPLIAQEHVIGVLWATRDLTREGLLPSAFSEDDLRVLAAIGDITANAIHRASLHEQTILHAEQLKKISQLGRLLAETADLDTLYKQLVESLYDLMSDVCGVFLSLYDPSRQLITCVSGNFDRVFLDTEHLQSVPFSPTGEDIHSKVIVTRQPVLVDQLAPPDLAKRLSKSSDPARSALYTPLLTDGKVIGLIEIQSHKFSRFQASDLELFTLVANTAAVEIQNARLIAQFERHVQRLTTLHAIDTAISSSTDLRLSLRVALEHAIRLLGVDAASVLLLNPITLNLDFLAGNGFQTAKIGRAPVRLGEGLAGKAALQRSLVQSSDPEEIADSFSPRHFAEMEKFEAYVAAPLISKGKVSGVLELFSRLPVQVGGEWTDFLNILTDQAALAVDNARLFDGLERANIELTMAYDATIEGWSRALDLRDRETEGHTQRVTDLTISLAESMGIPQHQIPHIRRGSLLHDIGKMGVPDDILRKPGPLTEEEWKIMHQHPRLAYEMLSPVVYLRQALEIPYYHHEKWDGSGYPQRLKGEQIPLTARIFAIVDVYDALTSDRPYRSAWSKEKVLDYIRQQSGRHFDPRVAEAFMHLMGQELLDASEGE